MELNKISNQLKKVADELSEDSSESRNNEFRKLEKQVYSLINEIKKLERSFRGVAYTAPLKSRMGEMSIKIAEKLRDLSKYVENVLGLDMRWSEDVNLEDKDATSTWPLRENE